MVRTKVCKSLALDSQSQLFWISSRLNKIDMWKNLSSYDSYAADFFSYVLVLKNATISVDNFCLTVDSTLFIDPY